MSDLKEISDLAEKQLELEGEVDQLTYQLKEKQKELRDLTTEKFPAAIHAAGIGSFVLKSGKVVTLKSDLSISIPKKRKKEVLAKLTEMGYGGFIQEEIVVPIPKGKDNVASAIMEAAAKHGFESQRSENVNSTSVKAVLRNRMKDGEEDDLGFFGATAVRTAVVK